MKRLHISIRVQDLKESVQFYAALFDAKPTVLKADYAKWMLDDPRVNFVIEPGADKIGVDHLGIQAETEAELEDISTRLAVAEFETMDQKDAICCYSKADKHWTRDPQGLAWETFYTFGASTTYGNDTLKALERRGF